MALGEGGLREVFASRNIAGVPLQPRLVQSKGGFEVEESVVIKRAECRIGFQVFRVDARHVAKALRGLGPLSQSHVCFGQVVMSLCPLWWRAIGCPNFKGLL